MTKINGSEPDEGFNLRGAEVLSPTTRAKLRDIPTRAQIKERIMAASDSARGIAQSLEMSSKHLRQHAASDLNSCDDVHTLIDLAKLSDRLGALKLVELETAVAAALHVLFHHLHDMPSEIANQVTEEALANWAMLEEMIVHEKQKIAANNFAERVSDIVEALFGGK